MGTLRASRHPSSWQGRWTNALLAIGVATTLVVSASCSGGGLKVPKPTTPAQSVAVANGYLADIIMQATAAKHLMSDDQIDYLDTLFDESEMYLNTAADIIEAKTPRPPEDTTTWKEWVDLAWESIYQAERAVRRLSQ